MPESARCCHHLVRSGLNLLQFRFANRCKTPEMASKWADLAQTNLDAFALVGRQKAIACIRARGYNGVMNHTTGSRLRVFRAAWALKFSRLTSPFKGKKPQTYPCVIEIHALMHADQMCISDFTENASHLNLSSRFGSIISNVA
jgi:hypothetical protein